ncbi:MAG: glycoside hydrolase family 15 protein, partial [Bacteroidia bacterium]
AHYEVAAGNYTYAQKLLKTFENYANETGLFPEQIWDAEDIPELGLYTGKASGGAMPLVWAHSEYIKLCRSIKAKKVFDMPPQTQQRYVVEKKASAIFIWNFNAQYKSIPKGKVLRIECLTSATVRWSKNSWKTSKEIHTVDSGLGIHYADLPVSDLEYEQQIDYTFYWHDAQIYENENYLLKIEKDPSKKIERQEQASDNEEYEPHTAETEELRAERDKIKIFLPS